MQEKKNNNELIGWKAVFHSYNIIDAFKDWLIPLILSLITIVFVYIFTPDTYKVLSEILEISLNILPAIVSLLLAAYAIVLTLFWSEYGKSIRRYENGRKLLMNLNSSFAAIILFMIVGLIISVLLQVIISLEIVSESMIIYNIANLIGIFIIVSILFLSIFSLKDITINIFGLGQITSIFDNDIPSCNCKCCQAKKER